MRAASAKAYGLLLFEIVLFSLASLAHGGWLVGGFEHIRAGIAEAVVSMVLAIGFFLALARPQRARRFILLVQMFAIVAVLVGVVLIAVGVGPQTRADLALCAIMLLTLLLGFLFTLRSR